MVNPLLMLLVRRPAQGASKLRRVRVDTPTDIPTTDAIFLVLRRMRGPLIVLITTFSVSVLGLSLIPGRDAAGNPHQLTLFDAFYVISYTATTIGSGELPYPFTSLQRMWVTVAIYASVLGWAYAIGVLLSLVQEPAFREALHNQQFRRRVRRLDEPFVILAGYGQAGRRIGLALDALHRRFVVVDSDPRRISALVTDALTVDTPGLDGSAANPAVLGMAGLAQRHCRGVIAVTDDDETNLAVVMAVNLLRPEVPVIARCSDRAVAERMLDFDPGAVINPYDRYGAYLTLALLKPVTHQLVSWLMNEPGTPMPPRREGLGCGRWVVVADDRFGQEVAHDLRRAGMQVTVVDPADGHPDVQGAVGFVAGAVRDATNLAVAAHARHDNSDLFICVRQSTIRNEALLAAFDPDSVFIPTQLVAKEVMARIVDPHLWEFLEAAIEQPQEWAKEVFTALRSRVGSATPSTTLLTLDTRQAPAVARWLRTGELTLSQLLADPDDRAQHLPVAPLGIIRDEHAMYAPDPDEPLQPGDRLFLCGRDVGLDALTGSLYSDSAVEYLATGQRVPATWVFRLLTGHRRRH